MNVAIPERRTAMYHAQLPLGAVMALADGWQLPSGYGDVSQEAAWLRDTVGVSDISPLGKLRVVGADASELVGALVPRVAELAVGSVGEADSPLERGGKLLAARLTDDEFLLLTPTGVAPAAMDAMLAHDASCAHVVDITSSLSGVSIIGPASPRLLNGITELDVSPRAMPDLACAQARFAEIQGILLRRDAHDNAIWQLYTAREFGEYLWEAIIHAAKDAGGGPAGTEALSLLR